MSPLGVSRSRMSIVPILWMDDEPEAIHNYRRLLEGEESGIHVEIATSIAEAKQKLRQDAYGAVVIDCKMGQYGRGENGARFLTEINSGNRALPTFVFSGFADDPVYQRHLKKSSAIEIVSKNENFELPLSNHSFFRSIRYFGEVYLRLRHFNPERVAFSAFIADREKFREELASHWPRNAFWITKEMVQKRYVWCVVCGDRMVDGSADLLDFPEDDALYQLGKEYNLFPFAYTNAPVLSPEESGGSESLPGRVPIPRANQKGSHSWAATTYDGDAYPTISIRLEEHEVLADFDTGARISIVPDNVVRAHMFPGWQSAYHLGKKFDYFTKRVSVGIQSASGTSKSANLPVWVVSNWNGGPFVSVNPVRNALIGRDILRLFELVVCLSSKDQCTGIHFIDELGLSSTP